MSLDIKKLYDSRFTSYERVRKSELWKILSKEFLQQYIKNSDRVVDVGAGLCEFINNIDAKEKIALDINSDVRKVASLDVKVIIAPVKDLHSKFKEKSVDVFFMSNLLEHLDSKEDVFRLLSEAFKALRKDGRLLIMQPDIGLVGNPYWDFFDHKVPITFLSLTEALTTIGYKIGDYRYPFLPYSTKVKWLPLWPPLLRFYLKLPVLQKIFGKQFFVVAVKN